MSRNRLTAEQRILAKEMKEMEMLKKQKALKESPKVKVEVPNVISFDQWWMQLIRKIDIRPSYKEIIKADFKSRGLINKALQEEWDKALELYGIKL